MIGVAERDATRVREVVVHPLSRDPELDYGQLVQRIEIISVRVPDRILTRSPSRQRRQGEIEPRKPGNADNSERRAARSVPLPDPSKASA